MAHRYAFSLGLSVLDVAFCCDRGICFFLLTKTENEKVVKKKKNKVRFQFLPKRITSLLSVISYLHSFVLLLFISSRVWEYDR